VRGASGNRCPYRDSQHWELIVATDFFSVEMWTRRGLQRLIVLFFIELSTRKVQIAGITSTANGLWMSQIARNLTDAEQGILTEKRYPIHDRDPLFTTEQLTGGQSSVGRNRERQLSARWARAAVVRLQVAIPEMGRERLGCLTFPDHTALARLAKQAENTD
jgi:hypothetical protein